MTRVVDRFLSLLGADLDERISTLLMLILLCALPVLYEGALAGMPVPQ